MWECPGDCDGQGAVWTEVADKKPVYVALKLLPYQHATPPVVYDQKLPGKKDLLGAYSHGLVAAARSLVAGAKSELRFDASAAAKIPYQTHTGGLVPRISLEEG